MRQDATDLPALCPSHEGTGFAHNALTMCSRCGCAALTLSAILTIAGCDIGDMSGLAQAPTAPEVPEVCAGQPAPTRDWNYGIDSEGDEALDFTDHERRALRRLHARGRNGHGVKVVIADVFYADGSAGHGTAVANIARRYAPNATFFPIGQSDRLPAGVDHTRLHLVNKSFAVLSPDARDELPVAQSRALRDDSTFGSYAGLDVYGAGNLLTALPGGDPARAEPTIRANGFVASLASGLPVGDRGYLHAKSAVLVVGAVNYAPTGDTWVLSHDEDGHSARAGAARNAFIVAPDDNRERSFAGTSFAAPRVTGALAILGQKCPTLSPEQLAYILLRSARDLGAPGVDAVYGYGLLDPENAIERAQELVAGYDDFDSTIPATTGP